MTALAIHILSQQAHPALTARFIVDAAAARRLAA